MTRFVFLSVIALLSAIILTNWNCSENPVNPPANSAPEIAQLKAPSVMFTGSLTSYRLTAKVEDAQGADDIDSVSFSMRKIGNGAAVVASGRLFDNGRSGDVLLGDGVFTRRIQGIIAQGDTGTFEISVNALDKSGSQSETATAVILIRDGVGESAPQILEIMASSSVPVDSSAFQYKIAALVSDGDGPDDIDSVIVEFYPPSSPTPTIVKRLFDDGTNGDETEGDAVYTNTFNSSVFKELVNYFFRVQAFDKAGNSSERKVQTVQGRLQLSNNPVITSGDLPRMVNVMATSEIFISADVTDLEGLDDIDSVIVKIERDGEPITGSPRQLFDDGNTASSGDVAADDGTFSTIFPLSVTVGDDPVEMEVIYEAVDKSGLRSKSLERKLVVSFNDKPYISDLSAPRFIVRDFDNDQAFLITLDVRDPQGIQDIELVQYRSFLPDGSESEMSPIVLLDNGNGANGDDFAGDGIYSRIIFLPAGGGSPGNFSWVFEARDNSGNISNIIDYTVTLENPGN